MPWYSWGYNQSGILGRGVATDPLTDVQPMAFPGGVDIVDIRASENSGVGLSADGHIYVWGLNRVATSRFCFGNQFGTTVSLMTPTLLTYTEASSVAEVAISNRATFWRKTDGTVWAVGTNFNGEFGTGEAANTYHATPVQLTGLPLVKRIFAWHDGIGLFAIDTSDGLWFAGRNTWAMDGTGTASTNLLTAAVVSGLPAISDICMTHRPSSSGSSDGYCAVALLPDGTVWTWGRSMIGTATNTNWTPAALSGVTGIQEIYGTAGSETLYLLTTSGTVLGLGSDSNAALCNGTLVGSSYTRVDHFSLPPVTITIPGSRTATALMRGAFTYAMMVITNDLQIWGWGLPDKMWGDSDPAPSITYKIPPIAVFPLVFTSSGTHPSKLRMAYEYCLFVMQAPAALTKSHVSILG